VNLQISLMLITIVVAMALFALERVPASVTGLGILLFLIVAGLLPQSLGLRLGREHGLDSL